MPYILMRIGAPYEGGWSILFHLPRNMAPSLNPRFFCKFNNKLLNSVFLRKIEYLFCSFKCFIYKNKSVLKTYSIKCFLHDQININKIRKEWNIVIEIFFIPKLELCWIQFQLKGMNFLSLSLLLNLPVLKQSQDPPQTPLHLYFQYN